MKIFSIKEKAKNNKINKTANGDYIMDIKDFSKTLKEKLESLEDWAYLIHHIHIDDKTGKEMVHNCPLVDHLGNLYQVEQIKDSKGKFQHCVTGLVEDQKVYWSDEEAKEDGHEVPCSNRQLGNK